MVSVLLSRLQQTGRVDGCGGDGGRDCYFSGEDGTDVYELKSFTGRMRHRGAAGSSGPSPGDGDGPRSWTLVVPIDPTPGRGEVVRLPAGRCQVTAGMARQELAKGAAGRVPGYRPVLFRGRRRSRPHPGGHQSEDVLPDDATGLALRFAGQAARLTRSTLTTG